jgi:hypothetical protein
VQPGLSFPAWLPKTGRPGRWHTARCSPRPARAAFRQAGATILVGQREVAVRGHVVVRVVAEVRLQQVNGLAGTAMLAGLSQDCGPFPAAAGGPCGVWGGAVQHGAEAAPLFLLVAAQPGRLRSPGEYLQAWRAVCAFQQEPCGLPDVSLKQALDILRKIGAAEITAEITAELDSLTQPRQDPPGLELTDLAGTAAAD